jgi:hypothetical protein
MRDPVAHRAESRGDEVVAAFAAVPLFGQETGIEQDAEVLGDRRPAHLEMSRNRARGAVGLGEEIEHPAPRWVADRPKNIWLAIRSGHHAASICK